MSWKDWFFTKSDSEEIIQNNKTVNDHEIVESNYDFQSVPIKDIKEYMYDEFQRTRTIEQQLEDAKDKILELKAMENKYKASLVLVEELNQRITDKEMNVNKWISRNESKDEEIKNLHSDIANSKMQKLSDDKKIKSLENELREYDQDFHKKSNVIKETAVGVFSDYLNKLVSNHKGVIPKDKFIGWVNDFDPYDVIDAEFQGD